MNWQYKNTVLLLCMLAFFVTMVGRLVISPVVPAVIAEFSVSNTMMGVALSGMWMAYSLMQFPSGVLADRYNERDVILVSLGGTAGASIILATSPFFSIFFFATVALGAAAGLHYTVATVLLERTYEDTGTAIGIHTAGAPLAGLTAPVASAWIGIRYGWRTAVALTMIVAVPIFILFAWQVRSTNPRRSNQSILGQSGFQTAFGILTRSSIVFTVFIAVISTFVWQGIASFLPMFLTEHQGQDETVAGLFFSIYFVVQGIGQVGVGTLSDHYGRDLAIASCMVTSISGFVLLIVGSGLITITMAVLLLGLGMSYGAAMIPRFLDNFSEAESGTGLGLVRTIYGFLGATGSVSVGFLADLFNWSIAFSVLIVFLSFVLFALCMNSLLSTNL